VIFSAIGDVPYGPDEIPELQQHVADHNRYSPSAFLVHLGDILSGSEACEEVRYQTVADILKASAVPAFIVPGDNEWVNCADPALGWAFWEAHLLGLEQSFCGIWPVESQAARPENFSFVRDGVLFLGLNQVSGTPSSVVQADADWVNAQFAAHGASARAAVLMAQAEPAGALADAVAANAIAFARPVLYIHGDGHEWIEEPGFLGQPNVVRVQVDRGTLSHPPVRVTVTEGGLFFFDRDPWPPETPEISRPPCGAPSLSIDDLFVNEGQSAVFNVTLAGATGAPVTVDYATQDGTARAGEDYQAQSGSLSFSGATTQRQVSVAGMQDGAAEPGESFFVNLFNPAGAAIAKPQGAAVVLDDDSPPPPPPPGPDRPVLRQAVSGAATNSSSVSTSASLLGVGGDLYLAAVSSRPDLVVTSVSGLDLVWTRVRQQCSGRGQTGIALFWAQGSPSAGGTVRASLAGTASASVISVARYSGVRSGGAIGSVASANSNGVSGACSGGVDGAAYAFDLATGSTNSLVFVAAGMRGNDHLPGAGYAEIAETSAGSGGSAAGASLAERLVPSAGLVSVQGGFASATDWAVVAAELRWDSVDLVVTTSAGGRVTLDPPGGTYAPRTSVTLTATPDPGHGFAGWGGDLGGTANPATLVVDANKSVTATFARLYTVSVAPSTGGSVVLDPAGGAYLSGTRVTVTAVAAPGYAFGGWGGALSGTRNPETLLVAADQAISADFPISYPVSEFSASPVSGAAPLVVQFTDLSTGGPTSWLWSFGDGATSTEQHPRHTYASAGVYDVTLVASNPSASDTRVRAGYVGVSPPPPAQTFLPTADAYVKSSSASSNYGTSSELRVKASDTTYRSYLRFDVGSLAGPAVISARLRLFTTDSSPDGGALYPVASSWTESGITWATAPAIGGAPIAAGAAVTAGQWREIDVTSWVRGTGTYAFALASSSSNTAYYSSRQGANPPQLVVQSNPATVPVSDFAATPTQGTAPLAVRFTDLSSGGPTSWLWTFGDGATSTLRDPSHTYASAGVYDVTLRASNALGSHTTTRSGFVQVAAPVTPVANFSATPLAGFAPLQVAFTDLSTNVPTSWLWSFGDGTTSTLQHPSKTYTAPGLYSVTLQASNAAGSNTRVRFGYVNVASGKAFAAAADARTSSGSPNTNYGGSSELRARGGATVYQSYLRFDPTGLAGSGVVSAKLRLFVTGASDSGGSAYRVSNGWTESGLTFTNAPVIGGAPLSSVGPASVGQWVEFDVTGAVGGDGSVSFGLASASSDSVSYSSREGSNPPQLLVWTGPPVAPGADFIATPLQGPAPLSVAFEDRSSGGPTSWLWSFGDGATSTLRNPVHAYASAGSYDVSLTVSNSAGTSSLPRSGYIQVSPPPPITTYAAAADAKTSSSNPTVNYGFVSDLRVRGGTGLWRSFLRFDVAGLSKPVVRATLRLYVDNPSDDGGAVSAVSTSWSEGAITWSTAPPLGATLASFGAVAAGGWVEVDVTSAVTGNGSYAFGLGSASTDSVYYGSRESAHPPQLVIETLP
jgi:PKD repeat protein